MKYCLALLSIAFLCSCGIKINSVVDESIVQKEYANALIVIPHNSNWTRKYAEKLETELEAKLDAKNNNIEIISIESKEGELALNKTDNIDAKIGEIMSKDPKELLIFCGADKLTFYNGRMKWGEFEIVGIDANVKKEVWKAQFTSQNTPNPRSCAKKSAEAIVKQLRKDKIL